jgi:hypothetical protein
MVAVKEIRFNDGTDLKGRRINHEAVDTRTQAMNIKSVRLK